MTANPDHGRTSDIPEDPPMAVSRDLPHGVHRGGASEGDDDATTMDRLRSMWERLDPVPAGLAGRVGFALEVDALTSVDLDLELMRLVQEETSGAGTRGDEVRTITFGSRSTTVMLALTDVEGGFRVDGWVAPGGARRIEVRTAAGSSHTASDSTGRFTLPFVAPGHFQLVIETDPPADGAPVPGSAVPATATPSTPAPARAPEPDPAAEPARRAVVTPALTL